MELLNTSNINNTYNYMNIQNNITNITNNIAENNIDVISTSPHQNFLSAKTLIVIIILLVHTIAPTIFEKYNFHYLHESGISMILGMLVGLISMLLSPTVIFFYSYKKI